MPEARLTEAACLLEQGRLYTQRVGFCASEPGRDVIFAGLKAAAFSVYSGDQPHFHFDLDGRWQRAFIAGVHYLKGLDGAVQAIDRVRRGEGMELDRRRLSYAEAADVDAYIRTFLLDLTADLDAGRLTPLHPSEAAKVSLLPESALRDMLDRIIAWDAAAWFAQRERYLATYGPLPLLPPDHQGAILLQATLGHSRGRAFGLAEPAEYYVRSNEEFDQHAREVARLLGRRGYDQRSVLLLGVDLLHEPMNSVRGYLETVRQTFTRGETEAASEDPTGTDLRAVHAIIDRFPVRSLGLDDWRALSALGLHRLTIQIESGDSHVRALYGRDWRNSDLIETVSMVKAAGLGVNILTLVGGGGQVHAEEHVNRTAELVEMLTLDHGDFVFLLDERELTVPELLPSDMVPLAPLAWRDQATALRMKLGALKPRGIKVLPYTLEKQRV